MAYRDKPYSLFNFIVDIGGPAADTPSGGFQEVSGLGMEITVAEYRAGNKKDNAPDKVSAGYKVSDVTLKRGVMGDDALYSWLDAVRTGKYDAPRTVTIELLSEDRQSSASVWKLVGARPMKYTGPTLTGTGTDVAVEELVLACEGISMEF
ncbi:MAG: phage tail protein [Rhodococcus sp. (in: high G+C Gram-positive bacteria)]|nr:MAG: phage tail protein [Rhodococcus sp. (in: high G+C Gram-positive bacteria)]